METVKVSAQINTSSEILTKWIKKRVQRNILKGRTDEAVAKSIGLNRTEYRHAKAGIAPGGA